MKVNAYANVAQKASQFSSNNNQIDKALIEKLVQLQPNNWPKFQAKLKKLHSAETCQAETQIKQKEPTTNTHTIIKEYQQKTPNLQLKQAL